MTISVTHTFVSGKSDGGDTTLVRPSNWNAEHTFTMATGKLLGRLTSGTGAVEEITLTTFGSTLFAAADLAAWLTASDLQASAMTWTGAQTINASFTTAQAFFFTGVISPTALSADTNDWAPTNFSTCNHVRASASAAVSVTGLAGGASGRAVFISNVGSFSITLVSESSSSTAGNRFALPLNLRLLPNESVLLIYDGTSARWRVASAQRKKAPTVQNLTSGTSATYTTPTGCTWIRVRAVGGGGGTQLSGSSATSGGTTTFNSVSADGGSEGGVNSGVIPGAGGAGGTGGSGTATLRIPGGRGAPGAAGFNDPSTTASLTVTGGYGGDSQLGRGSPSDVAGVANSGGGAGGVSRTVSTSNASTGGGGGGEYFELIIENPAATYTYTVGAGGSAGTSGHAGGSGRIIVEEYYD